MFNVPNTLLIRNVISKRSHKLNVLVKHFLQWDAQNTSGTLMLAELFSNLITTKLQLLLYTLQCNTIDTVFEEKEECVCKYQNYNDIGTV